MKAEDHIIAWIESSRPHYDRLLDIHRRRQPDCRDGFIRNTGLAISAANPVTSAYSEMLSCGDAVRNEEYSAAGILRAAVQVVEWELEQ